MTSHDALEARPPWPDDPLPVIRSLAHSRKVVALDDDPTGTQTMRDAPVLTRWSGSRLVALLDEPGAVAYLLTNSRSRSAEAAASQARAIGRLLAQATRPARGWSVISRSDSTLRGHFPAEVDALADGLGIPQARMLLAPFFGDGGRVTLHGVHYLRQGDSLVPVAETEFARDPVFGYVSSDLRQWVGERDPAREHVASLDLGTLREGGPDAVRDALMRLPPRGVLAVDAAIERDIEVVALGAALAEDAGLPLVARTAASYVRARAGQKPVVPLSRHEIRTGAPGLVVVGSHVPTSTMQLRALLSDPPITIESLELRVDEVLSQPDQTSGVHASWIEKVGAALAAGRTPVLWTSRGLVRGDDRAADLSIAARVSSALVAIVRGIPYRPAWVVAKGGITSSDIATEALDVDEAQVVGPLLPGVPVWRCGPGSRFPGLDLVVFPGNVGGPTALRDAVARMAGVA